MKTDTLRPATFIVLLTLVVVSERGAAGQGGSATGQGASATHQRGAATPTPGPPRTPKHHQRSPDGNSRRRSRQYVNVTIVSDPPDCNVYIDGDLEDRGTNNQGRVTIPMEPGVYDVGVSKSGYATEVREVKVGGTPSYAQEERFTLGPELRSLTVKTFPAGVKVSLDGKREGVSNDQFTLVFDKVDPKVEHTLQGFLEDYAGDPVTVKPYQAEALVRLRHALRPLQVKTTPPEADVYLDGEPKGKSNAQGILDIAKVEAGRPHELRAVKDGLDKTETVPANHEFFPITVPSAQPTPTPTPAATPTPTPAPSSAATPTPEPTPAPAADGVEFKKLLEEGRLARAVEAYSSLASSEPQSPSLNSSLDELLGALRARTSAALEHVGRYGLNAPVEEARELSELYERVRKWRPGDQALQASAEYWAAKYWQASAQLIASPGGREVYMQKARAAAQDAGAFNPQDARVLFDLGCLYVALGDTAAAAKYFEDARSLDDAWAYPLFALGTIDMNAAGAEVAKARKAARYERAVDNFTKAITLDPAFLQAYELRCIAYAVVNRHQESVASGQQAVALKPTSAYAHYALGFAYYQFGVDKDKKQYRNAINEFNLALTLTDDTLDSSTLDGVRQKLAVMKKALGIKP